MRHSLNPDDIEIRVDDLQSEQIIALLEEHVAEMYSVSQPESVHTLDLNSLREANITMWSAWHDNNLCGCGALKELDAKHAEIKSMRTSRQYLRCGVAVTMLTHLIAQGRERGYTRLSLETGIEDHFVPARNLYERFGFTRCGPFAGYREDPNSVFMTMKL